MTEVIWMVCPAACCRACLLITIPEHQIEMRDEMLLAGADRLLHHATLAHGGFRVH